MKKYLFMITMSLFIAVSVSAQERPAAKAGKVLRVPQEFKTIQRALDEADAGDTVFVGEGTYKESIAMRDDIVLTGASAELTIIQGNRKAPVVKGAQGSTIRNVTIEGGQTGILAANVFMTIENCVVRGNRGTGIHCLIALPVIRNNIVFRNTNTGIFLETTRSHQGYISNNVIAENNYSGINLAGQTEALVENNVLYFNKQYGAFAAEGARRSRIVNNIFFGNRQPGNPFAHIDASNLQTDPGYTAFSAAGYLFWERTPDMLKSRGRDGKDIGAKRVQPYKPSEKSIVKPAAVKKEIVADTAVKPPVKADDKKSSPAPVKTDVKKAIAVDTAKTVKTDDVKAEAAVDSVKTDAVTDSVKTE